MSDPRWLDPAPPSWGASASPGPGARALRLLLEVAQTVLIAGLLFVGVNLITARIRVEGNSMEPSLHDGEFVVVNRLAYRWSEPGRGDIVVFLFPLDPQRRFIKRIIGLPGDTVIVEAGRVFVNDQLLEEPYISAEPRYSGRWTIGAQEVFVLGDNRNNSSDSQNWGMLPVTDILGKAILVYWPPSDLGLIPHYEFAVAAEG